MASPEKTSLPTADAERVEQFAGKMMEVLNHAGLAMMISLGHRTGLFDSMAGQPPGTSEEIARRAGLSERYVREWLAAMVTGGIVEYDVAEKRHRLPPEHAALLTRAASPNNIAASMQWVSVLGSAETAVADAFCHGRGVPYSAYPRFHEVMAEESGQTVVEGLFEHILPLVPHLPERLGQGIELLDVGCGSGRALMRMAEQFPASQFHGYDFSSEAVHRGREAAASAGLSNLHFDIADAAEIADCQRFDVVTAFDAIHDQAKPDRVLRNIHQALRPGGVFLMQDIAGTSHVHEDCAHPLGAFLYSISCMHCMSVSLAAEGAGLGAMWGKDLAVSMLKEAGFTKIIVESLPHDIMNYYYVARKET